MSNFIAKTATHIVTTTPAENGGTEAVMSIRQIIMGGILAQRPKAEVEAEVVRLHPKSAAATKFAKHYAWYKGTMKKAGQLEGLVFEKAAPVTEAKKMTLEELEAEIARRKAEQAKQEEPAPETEEQRIERLQLELLARVEAELQD